MRFTSGPFSGSSWKGSLIRVGGLAQDDRRSGTLLKVREAGRITGRGGDPREKNISSLLSLCPMRKCRHRAIAAGHSFIPGGENGFRGAMKEAASGKGRSGEEKEIKTADRKTRPMEKVKILAIVFSIFLIGCF